MTTALPTPLIPMHDGYARDAAKVACLALAFLFAATMVAFATLRFAGLQRLLVPRSPIIGVGVAWTIVSMSLAYWYMADPSQLAPCTPMHALVVSVPQQAAFLLSLLKRRLVTPTSALKLAAAFLVGVGCLNLAHSVARARGGVNGGSREDEIALGAVRIDGIVEEVNATEVT